MGKLNGTWTFFFSEEQATEDNDKKSYVKVKGEYKEYSECIFTSRMNSEDYEPHNERYDDSQKVGKVINPKIKRGVQLNG